MTDATTGVPATTAELVAAIPKPDGPLAYARDATWHNFPSTTGVRYYHRAGPDDPERVLAACSSRIVLVPFGVPVRIANGLLCKRCFGARTVGE